MTPVHEHIEVERKRQFPVDGRTSVVEALAEFGWTADIPVTEVDSYYSRPDVDYMETVECLRVRRRGDFAEITYKPPSSAAATSDGVIAKQETNIEVGRAQADQAERLLENIGMRLLVRVEKHRTTYRHPLYPDASVSIDLLAGVGDYIETEVMSPDQEAATATLKDVENQLGVTDLPVVDLPYRDLVFTQ